MAEFYFQTPLLRIIYNFGDSEYAQELRHLLPSADEWNAEAQLRAGQILAEGPGRVPVDLVEAAKWTDLAARTSLRPARTALRAMITTHGWDIVGEGKRRAFRWQQERYNAEDGWPSEAPAAVLAILQQGPPPNLAFMLGVDLTEGRNFPYDYEKALLCFIFGAERDNCVDSIFNVGHAYYCGKGIKADPVQAIHWSKMASKRGYAKATFQLAILALYGHGAAQDNAAAISFCHDAEQQGHPDAGGLAQAIRDGADFY